MIGVLRRLLRLRGPLGVVALAVGIGLATGLVTAHLVLAAWTYRDASRRDLRAPGRWALAVLVGGIFAYVPYVLLQRATDWSSESRGLGAARRAVEQGRVVAGATDETTGAERERPPVADATGEPGTDAPGPVAASSGGRSLARSAARYGWKAARLGARGVGWAGRRAARELAD